MESKILIFPNPEDFLKAMDEIQKQYNKTVEHPEKREAGNHE